MKTGESLTVSLPAGQVLSLTVPAGTTGSIRRLNDQPGGSAAFDPTAINGANLTFGPFGGTRRYRINCDAGTLTYAIAAFEPSTQATDEENALIAGLQSGGIAFSAAGAGPTLKQGANGRCGTFVCNGSTPVTVANTSVAITDAIIISLNAAGGTVGAVPAIKTITAATGFTVAGTALDTSTYNYSIVKNAA